MASQRLALIMLLAIVAVISAASHPNDLIIGHRLPGDHLIQYENIKKSASKLGLKVTVAKTFEGDRYSNITQINARDQHTNGHGATAKLIAGGVGNNYVTLKFESERFRSIDFIVEIYGR